MKAFQPLPWSLPEASLVIDSTELSADPRADRTPRAEGAFPPSPWSTVSTGRRWRSSQHSRILQALTQAVELVAIACAARGVAAQGLPHLRGTGRAQHGTRCLVELETGGIERQAAEIQQAASHGFRLGHERFVGEIEYAGGVLLQPETFQAQEVDAVIGQLVEVTGPWCGRPYDEARSAPSWCARRGQRPDGARHGRYRGGFPATSA